MIGNFVKNPKKTFLVESVIVTLLLLLSSTSLVVPSCHAFVPVPTTTTTTIDWSLSSVKQNYKNKNDVSRRHLFVGIGMTWIPIPKACASQTAGEAIRRSAANLPGYGQADVFYPPTFLGKWTVTRTILSADPSYVPVDTFPFTLSYPMRFITVDDDPIDTSTSTNTIPKVIADRSFNEQSYQSALSNNMVVESTNWNPSNPNVLTIQYSNASTKEIKVTKRAATVNYEDETVSSSEFRRITTTTATSSVPTITASRILNKWKTTTTTNNNNIMIIEGIELIYQDVTMSNMSDPMTATLPSNNNNNNNNNQILLCKSKLTLTKEN